MVKFSIYLNRLVFVMKPRSAFAGAQSDQGLHYPLIEPLDTKFSKAPDQITPLANLDLYC